MNEIDIPILKKAYDLYKMLDEYRKVIPKQHKFTIYMRSEEAILDVIEKFYEAGYLKGADRGNLLDKASTKLNMLRLFVRLMKDTKAIDSKKYILLQTSIDEIGRMLGGWIRSLSK
jgi:hypothetical protein